MSLNNIQLPAVVLQKLFQFSLIDLDTFFTLGNNQRHILILVESDESLYLPEDQLNFLLGILAACSLTIEDVAILNTRKNKPVNYKLLTEELNPEKIFLFGVQPAQIELPLDFPLYQVQPFNHQIYLIAPCLSDIRDNKEQKTKLWNCLKQIFSI